MKKHNVLAVFGAVVVLVSLVGCGGSTDKSALKSHNEPEVALERAVSRLGKLGEALQKPDFNLSQDTTRNRARSSLIQELPYALGVKLTDAALRETIAPMLEELGTIYTEKVHEPLLQRSGPDTAKALEGVEECKAKLAEIQALF